MLPAFADRAPSPWFAGRHGGRAVLAQARLVDDPFHVGTGQATDCRRLEDCLTALTELAASTATLVPAPEVAGALQTLLARSEKVYSLPAAEVGMLRDQLGGTRVRPAAAAGRAVARRPAPGQPHVVPHGRTLFLDWESADPRGLPLWDTLYFFRSCAAAVARRQGFRDPVQGAARHMVDGSSLGDRLVAAVHRQAAATGLPAEAVGPLLHACWVHRALKEATRTPLEQLAAAPSVRMLRHMLSRPGGATLSRLLEGAR